MEENRGDMEFVYQPRKPVIQVPEQDKEQYVDKILENVLILSKECREIVDKGINTIDDLPPGKKEAGVLQLKHDLGCKWLTLLDYFDAFYDIDQCTNKSMKEEIEKEMNRWQVLIDLCYAKVRSYEDASDNFMPKIYAMVGNLNKIEDVDKVADEVSILDDDFEKESLRRELREYASIDKEDTEESIEDVIEKVKVLMSEDMDRSSTFCYLDQVLDLSRGIFRDLARMLEQFRL